MRRGWVVPIVGLGLYSAWLVRVEASYGQSALRPFVTDIEGPVGLFAVNTTLSMSLLLAAGVLWLTCHLPVVDGGRRLRRYATLQALVLMGLAFDDRFLVHEKIGARTGIEDSLLLLAAGVAQLALLWIFRDVAVPDRRSLILLIAAGTATAVMLLVDGLGAADAHLRLAVEELAKVWGAALLTAWTWVRLSSLSRPSGAPNRKDSP